MIRLTTPSSFISRSAATASTVAAIAGMPVWFMSESGDAPVPPSMPSITMTSTPALHASFTSSGTREAPILT